MKTTQGPKVLVIHRDYRLRGGEDVFLEKHLLPALKELSIPFELVRFHSLFCDSKPGASKLRDAVELILMALGWERLRPSYFSVRNVLEKGEFSHCFFNGFIPTVSLGLPGLMKDQGIQTLWWVHNQRLACANGLNFNGKEACHRCFEKGSRWAFFQKCHPSRIQSLIYALVYRSRRVVRLLGKSMDCFVGASEYSLRSVVEPIEVELGRKPPVRLIRIPPAVSGETQKRAAPPAWISRLQRPFFAFVGRVSHEKGADIFADLAQKYPQFDFVLGGDGPLLDAIREKAPSNLICPGFVGNAEKDFLFENCEALIIPSRVPENAGLVVHESHAFGTPVIYPRGGGAEETVHWLKREGCALDEFSGQKFPKRKPEPQALPKLADQLLTLLKPRES